MKLDEHGLPEDTEISQEFLKDVINVIGVVNKLNQKYKFPHFYVECDELLKTKLVLWGKHEKNVQGNYRGYWNMYITSDGDIIRKFIG